VAAFLGASQFQPVEQRRAERRLSHVVIKRL
jgi:hypothetical protein